MKKVYFLVLSFVLTANFSFAQWTTSGSNIYNSNSGNVGIGTTAPTNLLHIYGSSSNPLLNIQNTTASYYTQMAYTGTGSTFYTGVGNASETFLGVPNSWYIYDSTNGAIRFVIKPSGNVGIGTTTPQVKLDVNGAISMQSFANISSQRTNNNSYTSLFLGGALKDNNDGTFTVVGDGGSNYFGAIRMDNNGGNAGAINFYTGASTGGSTYSITNATLTSDLAMSIVGGNVAIGTSNPQGYKLAVNGNAIATAMTVKLYANWPDYVFKKEYQLKPLSQLQAYVDQNHHLPEMPSEQEVYKNGINLGEMDKLLTKKVEELTLYLIEKDKQLNDEKELTNKQQQQIDTQQQVNIQQAQQLQSQQEQINLLIKQVAQLSQKTK